MGKADREVMAAKIAAAEKKQRKEQFKQMKKKMKKERISFFADFKKFITRGNVLDMSVGVIVGGAFTAIVNGLSNFVLKPVINWLLFLLFGEDSLDTIYTYLHKAEVDVVNEAGVMIKEVDLENSIYIDWGSFINAIISFFLIAFVLFLIVRTINNIRRRLDAKELAAAEAKAKAEAEAKAAAEAEAAAVAAREQEIRDQFYVNVARQTELLEKIANK